MVPVHDVRMTDVLRLVLQLHHVMKSDVTLSVDVQRVQEFERREKLLIVFADSVLLLLRHMLLLLMLHIVQRWKKWLCAYNVQLLLLRPLLLLLLLIRPHVFKLWLTGKRRWYPRHVSHWLLHKVVVHVVACWCWRHHWQLPTLLCVHTTDRACDDQLLMLHGDRGRSLFGFLAWTRLGVGDAVLFLVLALHGWVPVILDRVVGSSRK